MNYPVNITLTKLKTLKDAPYPQEDKYPSQSTVIKGLMFEHTIPEIGRSFSVHISKLAFIFHTSIITRIKKVSDNEMILTTLNSKYKLEINEETSWPMRLSSSSATYL